MSGSLILAATGAVIVLVLFMAFRRGARASVRLGEIEAKCDQVLQFEARLNANAAAQSNVVVSVGNDAPDVRGLDSFDEWTAYLGGAVGTDRDELGRRSVGAAGHLLPASGDPRSAARPIEKLDYWASWDERCAEALEEALDGDDLPPAS